VLAFWAEIDAFKTQLKLTEGKPECVAAYARALRTTTAGARAAAASHARARR
jgi:hypothetical protein